MGNVTNPVVLRTSPLPAAADAVTPLLPTTAISLADVDVDANNSNFMVLVFNATSTSCAVDPSAHAILRLYACRSERTTYGAFGEWILPKLQDVGAKLKKITEMATFMQLSNGREIKMEIVHDSAMDLTNELELGLRGDSGEAFRCLFVNVAREHSVPFV